jgi:hypothetical protein
MAKPIWMKALSVISGVLACFCLYMGPTILLWVPPGDGEPYWSRQLALYGVLPTVLSAGLIVLTGYLWSRGSGHASLSANLGNAFNAVLGGLVLVWIVLILIYHLKGTP